MCFEDPKELMSCKNEQIDGLLWNTTMAGKTLKESCPRYQKGRQTVLKSCIQMCFCDRKNNLVNSLPTHVLLHI